MKKIIFLSFALAFSLVSFSQKLNESKVPQAVKAGFKKSHPNASPSWEMEDKNYEANFTDGGKTVSCILDKQGTILETETVLTVSDLPQPARTYLDQHYKGAKPKEVAKIQKSNGEVIYEVVLKSKELLFDATGNFNKVEKEKD
jgi:hypothetical protein